VFSVPLILHISVVIESHIPAVPSIALGSADISLFEMCQVYTMFPVTGL
jgi:hypothetical protein